tara:strand:+ start:349 stop:606 length:258 start_codon:yes stop_codon:yes gene_type:complete
MDRIIRILLKDKGTLLLSFMVLIMTMSFVPLLIPGLKGESSDFVSNKESILLAIIAMVTVMALAMVKFLSGSSLSSRACLQLDKP